jgi:hypothetical protein
LGNIRICRHQRVWGYRQSFNFRQFAAIISASFLNDRYLETDHAWGGGIDISHFFHRYIGIGVEDFVDAKRHSFDIECHSRRCNDRGPKQEHRAIGSALGRRCRSNSLFANLALCLGWGAPFSTGESDVLFVKMFAVVAPAPVSTLTSGSQPELSAGFGGASSVYPPHGWLNDFSWNVVEGPDNNFGMVRAA